jgi:hypothetical protein
MSVSSQSAQPKRMSKTVTRIQDNYRRMTELMTELTQSTSVLQDAIDLRLSRLSVRSEQLQNCLEMSANRSSNTSFSNQHCSDRRSRSTGQPSDFPDVSIDPTVQVPLLHRMQQLCEEGRYTDAFRDAFDQADDVLLARLMRFTGPTVLDTLQEPYSMMVVSKCISSFLRMQEFVSIGMDFIERAFDLEMSVTMQQRRVLVAALHDLSWNDDLHWSGNDRASEGNSQSIATRAAELRSLLVQS